MAPFVGDSAFLSGILLLKRVVSTRPGSASGSAFCYRVVNVVPCSHLTYVARVKVQRIISGPMRPFYFALAPLALALFAILPSLQRAEVSGASMEPTFVDGDRLLVIGPSRLARWLGTTRLPALGQVVAVRAPTLPDRVLIKRVASIDYIGRSVTVLGDAPAASTDSRSFGPVAGAAVVGRAVYRYAPAGRAGAGPWAGEYARP